MDQDYRILTHRHPCPKCWSIKERSRFSAPVEEPCTLCRDRGYVEIPLDEPGERILPVYPQRVRAFIYGAAKGLAEFESGQSPPRQDLRKR